ncbi:MAG: HEAT repeat domain-containing protein [Acidobacteriota bacterium]|nr:HEAT repeat domain-containing protein [Acidobacteriota bacterium]
MNWRTIALSLLSFLLSGIVATIPVASQSASDLDTLLTALQGEKTSNDAMQELLERGKADHEIRKYLAACLPTLIDQYKERSDGIPNLVWGNEARVAGELKIAEAAPVLARRIDMVTGPRSGGAQGYNFHERAADNALINIGPPAVPVVIEVLKNGNALRREIAAHILRYIGTSAAWQALEDAMPGERDPKVRDRIQEALDSRR